MSDQRLSVAILTAGVLLLLLLPLGIFVGTDSPFFFGMFALHLSALLLSFAISLTTISTVFRKNRIAFRVLMILCGSVLLISLLESTLPVTFRDSLIHHLAVPRWWIEEGRIFSPAWHEWSFYPMLVNLGYAGLIGLGAGELAGLYNWVLLVLMCAVIAQGSTRITGEMRCGAISFAIAATLPVLFRLAPLPVADVGLALFSAIAFFLIADTVMNESLLENRTWGPLVLPGIAIGLALGCKYNALPFTVSILLVAVMIYSRTSALRSIRSGLIIGVTALLVYAPWLLKNYVETRNPIYPLYSNLFTPSIERPAGLPNLKPIEQRRLLYGESPVEIALLPFRIFLDGEDNQPARFDGALSPLLLLGFLGFFLFKKRGLFALSGGVALLVIIISIFLNPLRIRYLTPVFGQLIFMTSYVLSLLMSRSRLLHGAAWATIGAHLVLFSNYAIEKISREKLIPFLTGKISTENYIDERVAEYPLITYINRHIDPDKVVYLLFTGNRFALYTPRTFSGGHYSASYLLDWIRKSLLTGKPLISFFHEREIDYLAADAELTQRFALEQLNDGEREIWFAFAKKHLRFVHDQRGFSLWQVVQ